MNPFTRGEKVTPIEENELRFAQSVATELRDFVRILVIVPAEGRWRRVYFCNESGRVFVTRCTAVELDRPSTFKSRVASELRMNVRHRTEQVSRHRVTDAWRAEIAQANLLGWTYLRTASPDTSFLN